MLQVLSPRPHEPSLFTFCVHVFSFFKPSAGSLFLPLVDGEFVGLAFGVGVTESEGDEDEVVDAADIMGKFCAKLARCCLIFGLDTHVISLFP